MVPPRYRLSSAMVAVLCLVTTTHAASVFNDDFDTGASGLWGNEVGNWSDAGGVYRATAPHNLPAAYSSLPFDLSDFTVSVDINNVDDGGIWLRSQHTGAGQSGVEGVLLVTLSGQLYWHVTVGGNYGGALNPVGAGPYTRVTVEVVGDTFAAFLDNQIMPATTLNSSTFPTGRVALYQFASQTFDNFSLTGIPTPTALSLFGPGVMLIAARRRR